MNKKGAPVVVPLDWKELAKLKNAHSFTMPLVIQRIKTKKDPWREMAKLKQALPN